MLISDVAAVRAKQEHILQARRTAKSLHKCLDDGVLMQRADVLSALLKELEHHCRAGGLISDR